MKKFLVAIIAIIYFTITCGIVINVNYCKDNFTTENLELQDKKPCKCSKKMPKSCCIHQEKFVKLSDTHKASEIKYHIDAPLAILQNHYVYTYTKGYTSVYKKNNNNYSPPIIKGQNTYKLNCVFRV